MTLSGNRVDSPRVVFLASAFNGGCLALAIQYVLVARRISKQDLLENGGCAEILLLYDVDFMFRGFDGLDAFVSGKCPQSADHG